MLLSSAWQRRTSACTRDTRAEDSPCFLAVPQDTRARVRCRFGSARRGEACLYSRPSSRTCMAQSGWKDLERCVSLPAPSSQPVNASSRDRDRRLLGVLVVLVLVLALPLLRQPRPFMKETCTCPRALWRPLRLPLGVCARELTKYS